MNGRRFPPVLGAAITVILAVWLVLEIGRANDTKAVLAETTRRAESLAMILAAATHQAGGEFTLTAEARAWAERSIGATIRWSPVAADGSQRVTIEER